MDSLVSWSQELHHRLGGPNYHALCSSSCSLLKKRKRDVSSSGSGLVSRYQLLGSLHKYSSPTMDGMFRLKQFRGLLEKIDVLYKKRSIGQRDFHDAFTIASLPHIVGEEEWDKNRSTYLELLDTDEYRGEVLITTPRRFGKTTAVSM